MRGFEQKVADFISKHRLLTPRERVLLAVSGGADSTALLHIMASLKSRGVISVELCCAHINHQLRGADSQKDEDFVINQCRKLKLPVFTEKLDVRRYSREHRLSIETAARELRIGALIEIARQQNCCCIATAHQQNDNAETILQRLIRGTGFRGLCGILPEKEFRTVRFIRPLLCVSRKEIEQYLQYHNIEWCIDRTNEDCSYRRNFIRHKMIGFLQRDCNDNLIERLNLLAELSRGFYRVIKSATDGIWSDVATINGAAIKLNLTLFNKQHTEVKIEIIRRILTCLNAGQQNFTERHYQNLINLTDCERLQLPGNIEAYQQGAVVVFTRSLKNENRTCQTLPTRLLIPGKTEFACVQIEAEIVDYDPVKFNEFKTNKTSTMEWFDFDKLKMPLVVRFRKTGDRFQPLGLNAEKRVGKFLTDEKIPQNFRDELLVIEDAEKIIWLCPLRIGEESKITGDTRKVLRMKVDRQND